MVVCFGAALGCSTPPARQMDRPDASSPIETAFVAAGSKHTCAVFAEGAVRCWGDNSAGQLGRSPGGDPLGDYSVDLGTGHRAAAIYAGQYHTCAILDGGAVKCWGDNGFGQLGLGDMTQRGTGVSAMGDELPLVDLGTGENAVALALGGTASCALLRDGKLKCWGDPYQGATGYGDIEPRGDLPGTMGDNLPIVDLGSRDGARLKVKTIAALDYHSFCAILDAGPDVSGIKCWGSNDYCELGIGSHDGGRGADPGSLGNNLKWIDLGTTASGAVRKAVAVAGAFQSVCVLGDDGAVACWGTNRSGELGHGAIGDPRSCAPDQLGNAAIVPLPAPATALGARIEHVCALLATGEVTCWGANMFGQLGDGDTMNRLEPSPPLVFESGFAPARLVLGDYHACATSSDKRVKCWGSDEEGQLGPPALGDRHAPGPDLRLRGVAANVVTAGADHTCVIVEGGALKCWGRNAEGQLGIGDTSNRGDKPDQMGDVLPAVDLGAGAVATAVAAGATHTCVSLADGAVRCWGAGEAGQLGQGVTSFALTPLPPLDLPRAATGVAAGVDFSCALLADGRVFCWGAGARGQLGDGTTKGRSAPGPTVALPGRATAIAAGERHACALLQNHGLACWGANDFGQLGVGDNQDRSRPTMVALGSGGAVAVTTRLDSTCAMLSNHTVKCWGHNARGQLGLGDVMDRPAPPLVPIDLGTERHASGLAAGGAFVCALLDTKQAKCWGDNTAYQLGANLRAPAYGDDPNEVGDFLGTAVQGGGRSVRAIVAGRAHACAILDTNEVRCWGDNGYGQLGGGDADAHSLFSNPSAVVDLGRGP